jgi:hypothetical protein
MKARYIEPRKPIWAVANISWADVSGAALQARATLLDISASGACLRVRTPIEIGARVQVKWHREQFSAMTRNCRQDGKDYLLGVHRLTGDSTDFVLKDDQQKESRPAPQHAPGPSESFQHPDFRPAASTRRDAFSNISGTALQHSPSPDERKGMESKKLFSPFWRRPQAASAAEPVTTMEAPVKQSQTPVDDAASGPRNELLSYEDIYHAAGLMSPRSGYGIPKVIEMLNSERIRDLSKDVKRASVLMALEVAGVATEELLQDAQRRQHALNSYEENQRKQLEEFETRKTQENARLQAEMERVAAHYAERIQRNRDQVAREKERLHNWQMAKQHEMQRIGDVIEVCSRQSGALAMATATGQGTENRRPAPLPDSTERV